MSSPVLFVVIVCSLTVAAASWQMSDMGDRLLLEKLRQQQSSSYCVNAVGKCFSTGQCCPGLVCAAFDDYFGQKPEAPGYCVKEKDLQVCVANTDCSVGSKCASLGRTGERYCLPRPDGDDRPRLDAPQHPGAAAEGIGGRTRVGLGLGLGSGCRSDSDCLSETKTDRLCCQDVRRGRQGVRRVCDRVTSISVCIP